MPRNGNDEICQGKDRAPIGKLFDYFPPSPAFCQVIVLRQDNYLTGRTNPQDLFISV